MIQDDKPASLNISTNDFISPSFFPHGFDNTPLVYGFISPIKIGDLVSRFRLNIVSRILPGLCEERYMEQPEATSTSEHTAEAHPPPGHQPGMNPWAGNLPYVPGHPCPCPCNPVYMSRSMNPPAIDSNHGLHPPSSPPPPYLLTPSIMESGGMLPSRSPVPRWRQVPSAFWSLWIPVTNERVPPRERFDPIGPGPFLGDGRHGPPRSSGHQHTRDPDNDGFMPLVSGTFTQET